jgi:hypothetical protein
VQSSFLYDPSEDKRVRIQDWGIENGRLKFIYNIYTSPNNNINYIETGSNNYEFGWNVIVYQYNNETRQATFYSKQKFLVNKQVTTTNTGIFNDAPFILIGGYYDNGTDSLQGSFYGIIHTIWMYDQVLTFAEIEATFFPPSDCSIDCNSYIGLFRNMSYTNSSNYFENSLDLIQIPNTAVIRNSDS